MAQSVNITGKRLLLLIIIILGITGTAEAELRDGDLIFHSSRSAQSTAIELATHSKYTHVGMLFLRNGEFQVLEAVQPVRYSSLTEWIRRGEDGHYVVKRLSNATEVLTSSNLARLRGTAESFIGKNYDLYFGWSDERIYCSELVWKAYERALGIEIGELRKLKDFDLSQKAVRQKLSERYGRNIPMEENVISPGDIFNSPMLVTVEER